MRTKETKVSIIMSVYNEPGVMLTEAIKSILSQSFKAFEFIIVLDNPSNGLLENIIISYAKKDNRIIFLKNEINLGLANSLNEALKIANGELIARMDADDISLPERIKKQVFYLENNPGIDFIAGGIEYVDEKGRKLNKESTVITSEKVINELLPYGNLFNHPTWMFRKNILKDLIGYRGFTSSQDYDFALRVKYYGYRLINMEDILLKYRIRNNSISVSKKFFQLKMVLYIQTLYRQRLKDNEDSFEIRKVLEIDKSDIRNFKKANKKYEEAIIYIKEKQYIKAGILLLASIIISKEQRKLFYNDLIIKHRNKQFSHK